MRLNLNPRMRVSVAIALLLLSGLTNAQATDCYVVSAGVENYPDGGKLKGDIADARNTTRAFVSQKGKMFAHVYATTLLDGQATHANIMKHFKSFARRGKAGDYFVLFFSGHGGRNDGNHMWFFIPHDGAVVNSNQLLEASDVLIQQGKNVVIIMDSCFSGQLNVDAKNHMKKYNKPGSGGLILLLSSAPNQTSNALGNYSAFAKAFADAMAGQADLNRDGLITLQEIRTFTSQRTNQLLKQNNNSARQNAVIAWSPSMNANPTLGALRPLASANPRPQMTVPSVPAKK